MPLQPYLPVQKPETLRRIYAAAAHNAELDRIDQTNGQPTPAEAGLSALLRTAICALVAGLDTADWDCVAQGLCLLVQGEHLVRQLEAKMDIVVK